MYLKSFSIKFGIMSTFVIAAIMVTVLFSVAMAGSEGHSELMNTQNHHKSESIKNKLDELAGRLEIKASQLPPWEEYSKSVEALSEPLVTQPDDKADATTIARYRAARTNDLAKKLTIIADATEKLQATHNDDQKKDIQSNLSTIIQ